METILTIILGIVALVFLMIALFFNKRNDKIIENIKSRGHFVVEENEKGEQNVYYISANGEKTRYVPYKEDATSTIFLSEQVCEMSNNVANLLTHVDALDITQTGIITRLNELTVRVRDMENSKNQPNTPF